MKKTVTLLVLLSIFDKTLKAQSLNFTQTISYIKDKIVCCAVPFSGSDSLKVSGIEIAQNGFIKIFYSGKKGPLSFNLQELYKDNDSATGVELTNNSRILQFHMSADKTRTIRFATPETAKDVYTAFQNLLKLCKKENAIHPGSNTNKYGNEPAVISHPDGAAYFVSRDAILKTENKMLTNSVRAADKQDVGNTTLIINSRGEGWLDKDSLPTGRWNFYAKDQSGMEYLFKTGVFSRTTASMFEVRNVDSAELKKNYGLSFASLQENQSNTIPFIKSANWNFYHPNGRLWKQVNYQAKQIPVEVSVPADLIENQSQKLAILLKEDLDEWINTEVIEYDSAGKQFKKLEYYGFSQVYKKTLYGKNGNVLKQETAIPYVKEISAENY